MKKGISFLIAACFILLTEQRAISQSDKTTIKKAHVLPVYLVYSGLPPDTSMDRIIKEAFTRHKVELISKTRYDQLTDGEVSRVVAKFRVRSDQFESDAQFSHAVAQEQHFVSNLLIIHFEYTDTNDSIVITNASWEDTPSPVNVITTRSSGKIETHLEITCCSPRDNIFAIVDKILFSKWLQ